MKKILALLCILSTALCSNLSAQEDLLHAEAQRLGYEPYPYWFVQVQGGIGTTFTNVKCTDLISPTASVSAGRWFKPAFGARLHVNGWESKGGFKNGARYKFNYINTDLDALLNVNNLFSKKKNHFINLILVGGFGLNYAWKNDELCDILNGPNVPAESTENHWGRGTTREKLYSHNLRLGAIADVNISKNLGVGLEVAVNNLSDRFNSKYNNQGDWMITAQLGLTYKFGHKTPEIPKPVVAPAVVKPVEPEVVEPVVEPAVEPVVVEKKFEPLLKAMYFDKTKSNVEENAIVLKETAEWAKTNPDVVISIKGYADKGTGRAKTNLVFSKKRAENVASELVKAGVPKSQIKTEWFGDTVQPYPNDNDRNRCVIIEGNK